MEKEETKYKLHNFESCPFCESKKLKTLGKRFNQKQGMFPKNLSGASTFIQRCTNCELIFSNPMPIPENLEDHYGVDPSEFWPAEYFQIDPNYFSNEVDSLLSLQTPSKGMKALDIGAGIGKTMSVLSKTGYDTFGLEPSRPFYEMALSKMNIDEEKLLHSDVESANFEKNQFDFITFGAVVEHLYFPSEAIRRAAEWLKKDGLIHIEVPSSNWLTSRLGNLFYKLQNNGLAANLSPMHPPYHLYEFSHKSFQALENKTGLEIAKHKYHVCNTYLPTVLDPIVKPYMKMSDTGMQLEIWLRKV